ncbi:hypothetical protein C8R47DRAFT_69246 [Mycena vitilis]|nr:hypothetical protein C8R47DRAFT_69246 [Mycena vitilis]
MAFSRRAQVIVAAVLSLLFLVVFPRWHSRLNTLFESPAATVGDTLGPTIYPDQQYRWITENQKATHDLFRCIERGDCAQNQTKVVLIWSYDYIRPLEGGYIGGEAIWALSVFQALKNMGYTVLFAREMDAVVTFYHIFGNLVKMVIASDDRAEHCWNEASCVRSAVNPAGIPVWKIFSPFFWRGPQNPLGAKWTLNPEAYEGDHNTYLGYSIEPQCSRHPFIPHAQRRQQAYILAKFLNYFLPERRAWTPDFFDVAANATGLAFVMASTDPPEGLIRLPELSPSIKNIGGGLLMNQNAFYDELSRSVALVGVGDPVVSPTPYDALCLGIPFINPIVEWDAKDPNDRTRWRTQHDGLKHLSAPYVYNVFVGDRDGFVNAIRDAAANPIQSYVLERMKMSSVEYRLGIIIEHDWEAQAATLLTAREAGLEPGPLFML